MDEIKSIWDGWERQCFFEAQDGYGGYCARGFIYERVYGRPGPLDANHTTEARVGRYIQQHYDLPESHTHEANPNYILRPRKYEVHAIIYANNNLKLTPDDFRRIDRETQIAEGMAAAQKLVDEAAQERPQEQVVHG